MLLVHELHEVRGRGEDAFELAVRERWLPALARDPDVRLLYFLKHAHGSGASYRVVTITALRDAAAWGQIAERIDRGDLREESAALDALRHDVTAKLLVPLPWSPLQNIDLAAVPAEKPPVHELSLFMEDTVWPDEDQLENYVERSGNHYLAEMRRNAERGSTLLTILGGFRTAFGAGQASRDRALAEDHRAARSRPLIGSGGPGAPQAAGHLMNDAPALRDRWESRLLRGVEWSPWY
jgi:hypothetical protein